jgi:hypothetical protein
MPALFPILGVNTKKLSKAHNSGYQLISFKQMVTSMPEERSIPLYCASLCLTHNQMIKFFRKIRQSRYMQELVDTYNETKVFKNLLPYFIEKRTISLSDSKTLLEYSAVNYGLLGLIGLLTQNMPRILLGKLCDNPFIREKCKEIKHTLKDLEAIADIYMEVEHTEAEEYVFRNVMLKYPRNRVDDNGKLLE